MIHYGDTSLRPRNPATQGLARSEELLAIVIITPTYKMFSDDSKCDWTRHLKDVLGVQHFQVAHDASQGLRRCVWWVSLQQGFWPDFWEKRRCFSSWRS